MEHKTTPLGSSLWKERIQNRYAALKRFKIRKRHRNYITKNINSGAIYTPTY